MRSIQIFIFLLFLSPLFSIGQTYQSMLNEGSFWDVASQYHDHVCNYHSPRRFYLDEEIEINGKIYKKLRRHEILNTEEDNPCPFLIGENYIDEDYTYLDVYLREDITEERVYIWAFDLWNGGPYQEFILYDFTLEVGDVLPNNTYTYSHPDYVWTVTQIQIFEGKKIIVLNNWAYDYTEGVGGYSGIVSPIYPIFEAPNKLYCYGDYENQNDCIGHLENPDYHIIDFSVYPNPTHEKVTIKAENKVNVNIFTLLGKHVASSLNENIHIISTLKYQPGIYLIKVSDTNNNYIKTIKLVVE